MIIIVGIMWFIYRAIMYSGYMQLGIVYTTILFILSPVLMLVFAAIFLKEKITTKQIVSTAVILTCVIIAIIVYR
jgi:drug/metabolite transporter (DMT)-like permease